MSSGSTVPDPDLELINAQNFNFAKPKLFFKNIGKYAATSTYIHVRIPFNFTTVFNTKQAIAGVYDQLLDKHKEPFKSITKSMTDISLAIIEGSLEDFHDIIKALPQKTEISRPGRPKQFIALGISIAAMAMSTFNTVRITQLNEEIITLKEKTDLILDVVHLHKKHLHHVEEKLEQTNKLLADLLEANIWFSSKVTDAIKKKFESVVWHLPSTTDWHLVLFPTTSWTASSSMLQLSQRKRTSYHSSPLLRTFFKLRSHIYIHQRQTNSHSFFTSQWWQTPIFSTSMSFCHCQFTSTSLQTFPSPQMLDRQISSQSATHNLFKQFPALIYMLVFTSETISFAKEGK